MLRTTPSAARWSTIHPNVSFGAPQAMAATAGVLLTDSQDDARP